MNKYNKCVVKKFECEDSSFFNEVATRACYLSLVPGTFVANVADTIVGIVAAAIFICSFGKYGGNFSAEGIMASEKIVSQPFANLVKSINPQAKFNFFDYKYYTNGKCISKVEKFFKKNQSQYIKSKSFLKKQIVSRLTFALQAVASVVARLADAFLGVGYATRSIFNAGRNNGFNNKAINHLRITGIVRDVVQCCTGILILRTLKISAYY